MASPLSRRRLLAGLALGSPLLALRAPALWANDGERTLKLYHTHTGETLKVAYWAQGRYVASALREINRFLRDFRTDDIHPIDTRLLDLLHTIRSSLGRDEPFAIISAYRSPKTNAMLAERSSKVAKQSLHMLGRAIDLRIPGVATNDLRRLALELAAGGVGYYDKSDFIHIDTGRFRTW